MMAPDCTSIAVLAFHAHPLVASRRTPGNEWHADMEMGSTNGTPKAASCHLVALVISM